MFPTSELQLLFPSASPNNITVVTVTHKTGPSEEEEAATAATLESDEEQQLQKVGTVGFCRIFMCLWHYLTSSTSGSFSSLQFVSGAKEMCFSLWTAGYWADFIDPTTGEGVSDAMEATEMFSSLKFLILLFFPSYSSLHPLQPSCRQRST